MKKFSVEWELDCDECTVFSPFGEEIISAESKTEARDKFRSFPLNIHKIIIDIKEV